MVSMQGCQTHYSYKMKTYDIHLTYTTEDIARNLLLECCIGRNPRIRRKHDFVSYSPVLAVDLTDQEFLIFKLKSDIKITERIHNEGNEW